MNKSNRSFITLFSRETYEQKIYFFFRTNICFTQTTKTLDILFSNKAIFIIK
jgi:hypothetical protein